MRKKRMAAAVALFTLLGFMACFPGPAAAGAKRGLLLWFNELVPVLFPLWYCPTFWCGQTLPADFLQPPILSFTG